MEKQPEKPVKKPAGKRTALARRRKRICVWAGFTLYAWAGVAFWANDKFWWATLLGSVPYALFFLLGLLWLGWAVRVRTPWLLALGPAGLGAFLFLGLPGRVEPKRDGDLVVRVMTWNIDNATDAKALAAFIRTEEPDIASLQEVRDLDREALLRELPNYRLYGENGTYILSRIRVKSTEVLEIPIQNYRRFVPVVTLDTPHGPMAVGGIHLVHGFSPSWLARPASLASRMERHRGLRESQVNFALDALDQRGKSVVLMGDFNLQPFGQLHRRIDRDMDDAGAEWAPIGTFPNAIPAYRLDRIWIRGSLKVASRKVAPSSLTGHRAVVVDLILR